MTRSWLWLPLAGLLACSSDPAPRPVPSATASAAALPSASASASAVASSTSPDGIDATGKRPLEDGEAVRKVSLNKARAVLWEAGWGRTGGSQSDDGYRLQKMKSDGLKLVVTRHRFDSDAVRRMRLPMISKDAAWVEDGQEVLAVQLTHRGGAVMKEGAHELLAALLAKGQDDTPLYREVKPPDGRPTMARIEKAEGKLRIAKSAVNAVVEGLQVAIAEDTTLDHQSERPVGDERQLPITATIKSAKGKVEVLMHCAEEGDRVVPTLDEAGVGGAIALKDRCALIVWKGRDAKTPSDPDASEALLRKLLGI